MKRHLLFPILIVLLCEPSFAQTDTAKQEIKVPTVIHYIKEGDVLRSDIKQYSLDTLLDDIEIVQPHVKYFYNNLSNNGSAASEQVFSLHAPLLTTFGNYSFDLLRVFPNEIKFYKTNKRFSELYFHQGSGKENQVTLTMAQNITRNWDVGFDFSRLGSQGFMNNGTTFNSNFDAFTWYHTNNNRYQLFASALWNSIADGVNGGLVSDSLYDTGSFSSSEISGFQVYLSDASQHWRNHTISLIQFYGIGHKKAVHENDSVKVFVPLFKIQTYTEYESGNYTYRETTDALNYYENYFFTPQTVDSLYYEQVTNRITLASSPISLSENKYRPLNVEATAGQQAFHYRQYFIDRTTQNLFTEASLFGARDEKKIDYTLNGKYIYSGDNKDDYSMDGNVKLPLGILGNLSADFSRTRYSPTFLQTVYQSNHFIWVNDFNKSVARYYSLKYELPKYHFYLGASVYTITDYIYYDTESAPSQFGGTVKVQQAFIGKNFHLGKIRFDNSITWQHSNNASIIPLPSFVSHNSLYCETWFFKKKLLTQFGIDAHYTSTYFAPAYNPAVSIFYLQQSLKTNGYALTDVFFNFKIKTARVFVKMQNATDGIFKKGYYLTPHYPMPGRVIVFGLNWRFFD